MKIKEPKMSEDVIELTDVKSPHGKLLKNVFYDLLRWLGENKQHIIINTGRNKKTKTKEPLYAIVSIKVLERKIRGIRINMRKYIIRISREAFNKFLIDKGYDKYNPLFILTMLDEAGLLLKDDGKLLHSKEYIIGFIGDMPIWIWKK